jgi:PST family polysaccharide transporter
MTLVKTSLLNGIAVLVKMLTLLGINKILAVYVGPTGYAALGQFQNATQMISTAASGAVNTGVVKYTAELHADECLQIRVWKTAGTITLLSSLFASILIAMFSRDLAELFLDDEAYGTVFLWFAAALVMFVFNALLLSIINGKKEIERYVVANIAGSILALAVTLTLTFFWGLYGALVALGIYQALNFVVTIFVLKSAKWFKFSYLIGRPDFGVARKLGKYAIMALISTILFPLSQIVVRDYIVQKVGVLDAGYWEAMTRLSAAYLMLITSTLSVYYLPRLSELHLNVDIRRELYAGYRIILPLVLILCVIIYGLRDLIISLLFTQDFLPMRNLFGWQLVGDFLKIGSWLLSYLMLSKAMLKAFVITEVIFSLTFVMLSMRLVQMFGVEGVPIAYTLNYLAYWLCVTSLVWNKIR